MGWGGHHLYVFDVAGRSYGDPARVDDVADDERLTVGGVLKAGVKRFTYTYDFGDDWEHEIVVEERKAAVGSRRYPACTAAKRNCPPDDCGASRRFSRSVPLRSPQEVRMDGHGLRPRAVLGRNSGCQDRRSVEVTTRMSRAPRQRDSSGPSRSGVSNYPITVRGNNHGSWNNMGNFRP
jgi:hypothetical protein